mgnify:CR=1 FL=1
MTTADYVGQAQPRSASAFGEAGALVRTVFETVGRWWRMRKALAELRDLDDRMLNDIGLSRSTLLSAARDVHGFGPRDRGAL